MNSLTHRFRNIVVAAGLAAVALAATNASASTTERATGAVALVESHRPSIDRFWSDALSAERVRYRSPANVYVYSKRILTACGRAALHNAHYCRANRAIYLDSGLTRRLVESGNDYAVVTILAHEWGHHVQRLLGWLRWSEQKRYFAGGELQADCYAGLYTRWAEQQGLLAAGDIDEAKRLFSQLGDRAGRSPRHPDAHGTSEQRVFWFSLGYTRGSLAECNGVFAVVHGPKH